MLRVAGILAIVLFFAVPLLSALDDWQRDSEAAAAAGRAFDLHFGAMRRANRFHDGKAQPRAAHWGLRLLRGAGFRVTEVRPVSLRPDGRHVDEERATWNE